MGAEREETVRVTVDEWIVAIIMYSRVLSVFYSTYSVLYRLVGRLGFSSKG